MDTTTRILVAYDGSEGATAALEDLRWAGFHGHVRVLVLSIADVLLPPDTPGYRDAPLPAPIAESFRRSEQKARQQLDDAQAFAEECAKQLGNQFPSWQIEKSAIADSPAWGILSKSTEWKADVIVVGALGMSSPARLILGSVSQRVVTDATCSVRVVHRRPIDDSKVRIVIGLDGSAHAERAVEVVRDRKWPKHAEVRLVTVVDSKMVALLANAEHTLRRWISDSDVDEHKWVNRIVESAAHTLAGSGLTVTHRIAEGNPRSAILDEAERWDADCIFVGARGLSGIKHVLLGSVSAAVASRARCTVEVVRTT